MFCYKSYAGQRYVTIKCTLEMVKTEQILHPKVAHAFPSAEFADGLSDYQAQRSNETVYPATPIGNREYDKPIDFSMICLKNFFLYKICCMIHMKQQMILVITLLKQ